MKIIYTTLLLSIFISVQGQGNGTQGKLNFPDIVPPSPTTASLMKFEEIPVDNYSGAPNITIPLYSFVLDSQLSLEMSLSYSSTGIKVDDIPGWVGCGWALNVGGSVSRTMIGKPDDDFKGIFNNGFFNLNSFTDEEKQTFYWNANRFKWDTEHDLFQYNFMGKTGRFYLNKDAVTGQIVPIDLNGDSKHLISVAYGNTNNKIMGITITDEFGYKYFFSSYDRTTSMSSSQQSIEPYDQYFSAWHLTEIKNHNDVVLCQFVYTLINETSRSPTSYSYNEIVGEVITNIPSVENESISYLPAVASSFMMNQNQVSVLSEIIVPGRGKVYFTTLTRTQNLNHNTISYLGYKLKDIRIDDYMGNMIKKFNFTLPAIQPSEKIFLTQIEELVSGGESHLYKLSYKAPGLLPVFDSKQKDYWGYFNSNTTNTLSPYHGAIRDVDATKVTYGVLENIEYPTGGKKVFQFESNTYSYLGSRILDPNNIEEIPENFTHTYKTWNVASNQSSNNTIVHFEGNQLISVNLKAINFYTGNPQDITGYKLIIKPVTPNFFIDPNGLIQEFDPSAFSEDDPNSIFARNIYAINIADCGDFTQITECIKEFNLKGWYSFSIVQDNYLSMQPVTYNVSFYYRKKTGNQKVTLGGGLRIRKVKFTDANQNIDEVVYNYNLISDNTMSSGSQSLKPKKQGYHITRDLMYYYSGNNASAFSFVPNGASYFVYDDQSGLELPLDKGSYIGYKNVSVRKVQSAFSETTDPFNPIVETETIIGGKQEYIYTSPIDFPDYDTSFEWQYPFVKNPSVDFKRGLLLEAKMYDESLKLQSKEVNEYNYFSNQLSLGFSQKEKEFLDCPLVNEYSGYNDFKEALIYAYRLTYNQVGEVILQPYQYGLDLWNLYFNGSDVVTDGDAKTLCPKATRYLYQIENVQVVGWAKLNRKINSNYFYEGNQSREVVSTQSFDYNSNKLIKSVVTELSNNATLEAKYFYANDLSNQLLINKNMIAIPLKTESYRNGEKTATQNTVYKDWGNGYIGLDIIQESKASAALENRIQYNLIDNSNGNVQEVSMVDGMTISYIWGYNKTQPVAKLENIAYSNIPANLISDIQAVTSSPTSTETQILSALNALRTSTDVNLQKAMITTFTFKPLVGVTSVTDPKGDKMTYIYDDFNRLKEVRDKNNNILSENEYHYRTQN